ncbi:AAA family ATPase [Quadrisphaera sp. INWT6]|uniref:AAA family ATPase n=1 Tax=Quadrisphaera sp. INWT6 TaxID=2596917 RepID=UPI00189224F4|nr:AAA family ATPase [Quadrisphaera sp. INWT6]MBF5082630.1 AAA family ATPase [Quadrisphaera sp. INWT6]
MPDDEVLTGGNSSAVSRRGCAVHRRAGPWTPTVHRLLEHLHSRGTTFLPRPLGFDEQGREVLTHLPGTVPSYPVPAHVWAPAVLATVGRWLAEVHAASRDFLARPAGAGEELVWQQPAREPVEVVCLNDVAPYNAVFDDDGGLTGWIDVDTAAPGPRARDLAHAAHRFVPLSGVDGHGSGAPDLARQRRRLAALCQAYATAGDEVVITPADVLAALEPRLEALADDAAARHAGGAAHLEGHAEHYRTEAAWLASHAEELAEPPVAQLVVVNGPIASGKSTTAAALAAAAATCGRTAAVVDVDDVAEAVTAPGAGASGLWLSAHHAHGSLVARWLRTPLDVVVAVGPFHSPTERAALVDALPPGTAAHWVLLDTPVETTLERAQADATRGISREEAFHRERHERYRRLVADGSPAAQVFDTSTASTGEVVAAVVRALGWRAGPNG